MAAAKGDQRMTLTEPEEPTELRRIARALPRKRAALVVAIVSINLIGILLWHGYEVAEQRLVTHSCYITCLCPSWIPPWRWSEEERAEAWPWVQRRAITPRVVRPPGPAENALGAANGLLSELTSSDSTWVRSPIPKVDGEPVFYVAELCDEEGPKVWLFRPGDLATSRNAKCVIRDEWGQAVRVRLPGRVNPQGSDVWSCGPNMVDDQGGGDDILSGEAIAAVGT